MGEAICCSQFIGECYNAPKTTWSAGKGVEFGQLILRKIINNVATRQCYQVTK